MLSGDFFACFLQVVVGLRSFCTLFCSDYFGLPIALVRRQNAFLLLTFSTAPQHNDRAFLLAYCKQNVSLFVRFIPIHGLLSSSAQHYSLRTIYNYIEYK